MIILQSRRAQLSPKRTLQYGFQMKFLHTGRKFIKYSQPYVNDFTYFINSFIGFRVAAKKFDGVNE